MRTAILTSLTSGSVAVGLIVGAASAGPFPITVMDQIGSNGDSWMIGGASSSQFPPGSPQSAFSTVDNFTVTEPVHITQVEGVVGGLSDFVSFDLIDSWTVQIYTSLSAATKNFFGDALSASYDEPTSLTRGFSFAFGFPYEVAAFDVDVVLQPGEYWVTVAMGNDGDLNGTVGIRSSSVGDGAAYFAIPSQGLAVELSNPAAYRIMGTIIPAPGFALLFAPLGIRRRRRSKRSRTRCRR